jgi:ABC-type sugar transport system permease subunit
MGYANAGAVMMMIIIGIICFLIVLPTIRERGEIE